MKEYWHEIRQENYTEMYFRESKIIFLPTHLHRPIHLQKTQYLTLGHWVVNKIQIHDKLVMWKKIQKELFQFDDIDDDILANAASEAESTCAV